MSDNFSIVEYGTAKTPGEIVRLDNGEFMQISVEQDQHEGFNTILGWSTALSLEDLVEDLTNTHNVRADRKAVIGRGLFSASTPTLVKEKAIPTERLFVPGMLRDKKRDLGLVRLSHAEIPFDDLLFTYSKEDVKFGDENGGHVHSHASMIFEHTSRSKGKSRIDVSFIERSGTEQVTKFARGILQASRIVQIA